MDASDMPPEGGKSKGAMPWYKRYPDAWLDGTRKLTPEQRGIYNDCLELIYKYDRELPKDDDWVSHQLHVKVRVWRKNRDALLRLGKLIETTTGYINSRAEIECKSRAAQRSRKTLAAENREEKRRVEPEFPFENNERRPQLCLVESTDGPQDALHARAPSDHQIIEKEKKAYSSPAGSIDDDRRPKRTISPATTTALANAVGEEQAQHLVQQYLASSYARNAKVIDRAFVGWLKNTYEIKISSRGSATSIADVIALLPIGPDGRPDTRLPTTVTKNIPWRAAR